jgi:hypothetical protein
MLTDLETQNIPLELEIDPPEGNQLNDDYHNSGTIYRDGFIAPEEDEEQFLLSKPRLEANPTSPYKATVIRIDSPKPLKRKVSKRLKALILFLILTILIAGIAKIYDLAQGTSAFTQHLSIHNFGNNNYISNSSRLSINLVGNNNSSSVLPEHSGSVHRDHWSWS